MKIPRALKLLLLVVTMWPLVYSILAVTFILDVMIRSGPSAIRQELFVLHIITVGAAIALIVAYGFHLYKNDRLTGNAKMIWLVGIVFGSFVAMPLYWWKYIWKGDH